MKNITVAIELTLRDDQMLAIASAVPGESPLPIKISRVASGLLRDLAEGGLMLPPEATDRIRQAIASVDSQEIVDKIEDSVNRQGEHLVMRYAVDPAWEQPLREMSELQSRPIEALLQEFMDLSLPQALFSMTEEPPALQFTRESHEWLRHLLGKKQTLFGEDVIAWMQSKMQKEEAVGANS